MLEKIVPLVRELTLSAPIVTDENSRPGAIQIHPDDLLTVCGTLYRHPETYFDMLSCITGIDNGVDKGTIDIAYNLYSIPFDLHVMIRISLPRDGAVVDSLTPIWKTANWHEREIYDMFGVTFRNHPDMRRILLPADWVGHPLRKDYKQQDYYKGIKTDY